MRTLKGADPELRQPLCSIALWSNDSISSAPEAAQKSCAAHQKVCFTIGMSQRSHSQWGEKFLCSKQLQFWKEMSHFPAESTDTTLKRAVRKHLWSDCFDSVCFARWRYALGHTLAQGCGEAQLQRSLRRSLLLATGHCFVSPSSCSLPVWEWDSCTHSKLSSASHRTFNCFPLDSSGTIPEFCTQSSSSHSDRREPTVWGALLRSLWSKVWNLLRFRLQWKTKMWVVNFTIKICHRTVLGWRWLRRLMLWSAVVSHGA